MNCAIRIERPPKKEASSHIKSLSSAASFSFPMCHEAQTNRCLYAWMKFITIHRVKDPDSNKFNISIQLAK